MTYIIARITNLILFTALFIAAVRFTVPLWTAFTSLAPKEQGVQILGVIVLALLLAITVQAWKLFARLSYSVTTRMAGSSAGYAAAFTDHSADELHTVAEHEARHAVIARALGFDVEKVTTRKRGNSGGHMRLGAISRDADQTQVRWNLAIVHLTSSEIGPVIIGPQADDTAAVSYLTQIIALGTRPNGYDGALELSALHLAALAEAQRLVTKYAEPISQVADALLEHRELDAETLEQLASPQPATTR